MEINCTNAYLYLCWYQCAIFVCYLHTCTYLEGWHYCSHTKYVSKLHGESFHLSPLPSRFHSSKQFSSSPFSYRKLFGSPAFQLVNVMGLPVAIQKKLPSSAKSVPDVQKCSLPKPAQKYGPAQKIWLNCIVWLSVQYVLGAHDGMTEKVQRSWTHRQMETNA